MRGNNQIHLIAIASLLVSLCSSGAQPQTSDRQDLDSARIEGTVRDWRGNPVAEAYVRLTQHGDAKAIETKTDVQGNFVFSSLAAGTYVARAQKSGVSGTAEKTAVVLPAAHTRLDLQLAASAERSPSGDRPSGAEIMPLDNKTDFEVAGVTDWTAAGGHGSDANLRASESLATDTRALRSARAGPTSSSLPVRSPSEAELRSALGSRPQDFALNHQLGEMYFRAGRSRDAIPPLEAAYRANPSDYTNGYHLALSYQAAGELRAARDQTRRMLSQGEHADLYRLLGDIDEQMQDPLSAVRAYEHASRIDPSEPNYFAWGVELLVHRALQPASEVFARGAEKYPQSERMLEGLGAALYANGAYDQAAEKLCAASDLNADDHSPYLFLAKMEQSAPQSLACAEEKLRRFLHQEPENAWANYDYAIALRKREQGAGKLASGSEMESLLHKAIALDPHFAEAYLALGALYAARGDFNSAISQYQKALGEKATLAEAHFRLGQAYKRVGEPEKAREEFQAYERTSKTEAAAIDARRREVRQFVIVLKQQPERPTSVVP